MSGTVPDIVLERYRLGEVTSAERDAVEARLREDDGLRLRLADLERSDEEIRARYPARNWVPQVPHLGPGRAPLRPVRAPWLAALAAAAVLLVVLRPTGSGPGIGDGGVRLKGSASDLLVFRKTANGSEPLSDGNSARAGDLLRVGYRAQHAAYGAIVSVDGRGLVTQHLPVAGRTAVRLRAGEPVLLDRSYELDDAPRWERFYLVTSGAPFDVGRVADAARGGAPVLALAPSLDQVTFLVKKESRP
jgi:hypothetical protein